MRYLILFSSILFLLAYPTLSQTLCDSSCLTCSGNSNTQCLSCSYRYYLQGGSCILHADFLSDVTSELKVDANFFMFWKFNLNNTVTLAFRWSTSGFISLGFGTSMGGLDIIAAEKSNNQILLNDYWSDDESTPSLDTVLGGSNDLDLQNYLYSDSEGYAIAKFTRKLSTGDRYDYTIQPQSQVRFSYAYANSDTMSYHGPNVYLFSFNFKDGEGIQTAIIEKKGQTALIKAHGIGLLIAWSFLVDFGIIIVRYFKHLPNHLNLHVLTFILVDFYTLIITFWVIGKNADSLPDKFETDPTIVAHFALGVIVLFFLVFQHIGGIVMKKTLEAKKATRLTSMLGNFKKMHQILGGVLYLVTKATVLVGIWVYDWIELFIGFCVYYGILFVFRLILELHYQTKSHRHVDVQSAGKLKQGFQSLVHDLEEKKMPAALLVKKYPKLRWCLMNNTVYDLGKFDHPGGNYIIEEIIGREIGRFFFGAYALESSKVKPYNHTGYAIQLLEQMKAGEIELENISILQKINPARDVSSTWQLTKKTKISENIMKVEFFSNGFTIKNNVSGVEWLGRHFTVRSTKPHHKLRLYTTVLCYTDENIEFRNNLIEFFNNKMTNSSGIKLQPPAQISQNLPLIIKRYDFPNTLSAEIHNANIDDKFEIQGPLGVGLELTSFSNGDHVIFCGGTGILPFVDLLDFLLKKNINKVLQTMLGAETAAEANILKHDFENTFGNNFRVLLFAAFQSKEELDYLDFIFTLHKINKKHNLTNFDMVLRFNDKSTIEGVKCTSSKFDDAFFKDNVDADRCSRIFVCGNPGMMKQISEICVKNKIDKEKVVLV